MESTTTTQQAQSAWSWEALESKLKKCECGKPLTPADIKSNNNDMCAECYSNYCCEWEAWQQSNEC